MDDNFSLFEELGIEIPEIKEEKKAKPEKKEIKKQAPKTAEKKEEKLSFPLTVVTGVEPVMTINKDEADGIDTLEKVKEFVCKRKGMPVKFVVAKRLAENKVAVVLDRAQAEKKGEHEIDLTTVIKVGGEEISLAEIAGKRNLKEISEYLAAETGHVFGYSFFADGGSLYALVGESLATGTVSLPVRLVSELGAAVFSEEDFDEDDVYEAEGEKVIDLDDLAYKVFESAEYSDIKDVLALYRPVKPQKENVLYIGLKAVVPDKVQASAAPKETTYPTDATISLLFSRIQLTPEMFGGKDKATEKEIIAVLGKDYPEYSESRTRLTYDKDGNYIFPSLKSSSKGADHFGSREEAYACARGKEYSLSFFTESDGAEYRLEVTPVSVTEASEDGKGRFLWKLPSIPLKILEAVKGMFARVNELFGTEALVWIGYSREKGRYKVFIPEQQVGSTAVTTHDDIMEMGSRFGYIPVAEIHSHNRMNAFFSSTDDSDEMGNRVYGVMGRFGSGCTEMKFRSGTGGRFVSIKPEEVFADGGSYTWYVPDSKELFEEWCRKSSFARLSTD